MQQPFKVSTLASTVNSWFLTSLKGLALVLVGLVTGASSVLLPQSIPLGIVALVMLVLLWALPELQRVPHRLLKILFAPFVLTIVSVPIYLAIVVPGLPWLSIRRIVNVSFVVVFLLTVSASSMHRNVLIERLRSMATGKLALGYILMLIIATLASRNPTASLNDDMASMLAWYIPFLAIVLITSGARSVERSMLLILCGAIIDFLLGIPEFILRKPFIGNLLSSSMKAQLLASDPGLESALNGSSVLRNGMYRAQSVFATSISWSELAGMSTPLALHFLFHGSTVRARAWGTCGVVACALSVVMSGARGGYVSSLLGSGLYLILWTLRQLRRHPMSLRGPIMMVMFVGLIIMVTGSVFFVGPVRRYVLGGYESQSSSDARSEQWAMATPKILASPVVGYGPGTAAQEVGWTNAAGDASLDSYIIALLINSGVPGCVLFFGMILAAIMSNVKMYLSDVPSGVLGGALSCSLFAYSVYRVSLNQVENNGLMLVVLGLSLVLAFETRKRQFSVSSSNLQREQVDGLRPIGKLSAVLNSS